MTIQYDGCDIEDGEMTSLLFSSEITIPVDMVTPVFFNGEEFIIDRAFEDTEITLEDIYNKLLE